MQRRVKVNDRGEEISTGNNNDNEKVPFSADPDFFELPSPAVSILVLTGLFYLMPAVAFWPEYLPPDEYTYGFLRHLSEDYSVAVRNSFFVFLLIHLFEASVAVILGFMIDLDIDTIGKWFLNVLFHGYPALKIILTKMYEIEQEEKGYEMKLRLDNVR